ncbi:MAG: hypothetical protein AABX11_06735 [Nanoarchaeota archaeon]
MAHNMTVTVEDTLWTEMKKYGEVRWSYVMKEAAKEKLRAMAILKKISAKSNLSEKEIEEFSVKLGKKINK